MLFALCIPPLAPWWVTVIGTLFGFYGAVILPAVIVLGLSPLGIFVFSLLAAVVTTMSAPLQIFAMPWRWSSTCSGVSSLA